jgi:hypothetical protein
MADATRDPSRRRERLRRRVAAFVFALFPTLIGVGVLAPGFVQLIAAQDTVEVATPPLQNRPLDRPPLLVPRDYSAGFVPELLDLEELFSTRGYTPSDAPRSRVLGFPRSHGDQIVLDDSDPEFRVIAFRDALAAAVIGGKKFTSDPYLPLSNPLPRGDGLREDDFPGNGVGDPLRKPATATNDPPPVVPEPGTGALLAGGVLALGIARSRRLSQRGRSSRG